VGLLSRFIHKEGKISETRKHVRVTVLTDDKKMYEVLVEASDFTYVFKTERDKNGMNQTSGKFLRHPPHAKNVAIFREPYSLIMAVKNMVLQKIGDNKKVVFDFDWEKNKVINMH